MWWLVYNGKYCAVWYGLSATALPSVWKVPSSMQILIHSNSKCIRWLQESLGTSVFLSHTAHACMYLYLPLPFGSLYQPKLADVLLGSTQSSCLAVVLTGSVVNSGYRQTQPAGSTSASSSAEENTCPEIQTHPALQLNKASKMQLPAVPLL